MCSTFSLLKKQNNLDYYNYFFGGIMALKIHDVECIGSHKEPSKGQEVQLS